MRKLIWDLATMRDRAFGSTTMILHASGTTIPGSPAAPEYLRAAVYLPPAFLRRFPETHNEIAAIVQRFIECVGVSTARAWEEDAKTFGWRLTQPAAAIRPNRIPRTLDDETSSDDDEPAPSATSRYGSQEPVSGEVLALLTATERIASLEGEVQRLHTYLESMSDDHVASIAQLSTTEAALNASLAREEGLEEQRRELQAHIATLQAQVTSGAHCLLPLYRH
ncbi:hypothetical protein B0H10DRAFT_2115147 [Mycena sp. CBHHK59/15]|nr:hypothetical protein B0H10DRAFT_2115147 [Mycena sp. CBHHK59/15]